MKFRCLLLAALLFCLAVAPHGNPPAADPPEHWTTSCSAVPLELLYLLIDGPTIDASIFNDDDVEEQDGTLVLDVTFDGSHEVFGIDFDVSSNSTLNINVLFPSDPTFHGGAICARGVGGITEAPDPVQVTEEEVPEGGPKPSV